MATFHDNSIIYCPPVDFIMEDFQEHKTKGDRWLSPFFYTHNRGYPMCLEVLANGCGPGQDTHVSVFVDLVATEADHLMRWPFRGMITISLLSQQDDCHITNTVTFTDNAPDNVCARVTNAMVAKTGWGIGAFASHSDLAVYLKDNKLHFRIEKFTPTLLQSGSQHQCFIPHRLLNLLSASSVGTRQWETYGKVHRFIHTPKAISLVFL